MKFHNAFFVSGKLRPMKQKNSSHMMIEQLEYKYHIGI